MILGMIQRRRVRNAVTATLDTAAAGGLTTWSLEEIVQSIALRRGREIFVDDAAILPVGVTGRWVQRVDHDEIQIADGLPTRDFALAHELGHMILEHSGLLVHDVLAAELKHLDSSVIHRMLGVPTSRILTCTDSTVSRSNDELEAEIFARLLLAQIERRGGYRHIRAAGALLDAFA